MERKSSFGASWADQWDYSDSQTVQFQKKGGGGGSGGGGEVKNGIEKTKAVASSGFKKVKEGTNTGFQWIKHKCQNKKTARHYSIEGSP